MATETSYKINKSVEDTVLQFGRYLIQHGTPISKLVIFGSYAKNNAHKYSDIDVCVVSPKFGKDPVDEMQYLFKQRRNVDSSIEPYPASLEAYEELESPIIWEIRKYGKEITALL